MIFRIRPSGAPRRKLRLCDVAHPAPIVPLPSAFATRRAIFGPHELREDRVRAEGYLADDLSPALRRAIREHSAEVSA